ncbi:MAG: endolytic transglycosylase MltG [Patescibacteria group bacterium]
MSSKYWNVVPIAVLVLMGAYYIRYHPSFVFIPNDVQVVIPEGTNIADIDRLISEAGVWPQGTLLKSEYLSLEGTLFPDTYRFDRGSTAEDVITRMQAVKPLNSGLSGFTAKSLIIASMLEKEVQIESDMRIVTGIIEKRLAAGMPLQLDATVAYGACLPRFNLGEYCDVSQVNLVDNIKRDSAYNTYTRRGLPVGPISNPGLKALRAAENPHVSDYWYYLSKPDGTTVFSRTLEEHNTAKWRFFPR